MDFHVIENVKQQVLDMAKTYKNFYIFIDYGYEAYAYAYFHYVYKFITKNELQHKVIFACANENVQTEHKLWCLHRGVSESATTLFFNRMFSATRDAYINENNVFNTNKTKWFCCLNHRPHPHRLGTIIYLDKLGLLNGNIVTGHDKNYEVHYGTEDPSNNYDNYVHILTERITPEYKNIILSKKDDTYLKLPLIYDNFELHNGCQPFKLTGRIFNDCLINLVTETYYFNFFNHQTPTGFITEKTLKAIVAKQIFIIIGERGLLKRIRDMGFRTFSDFIDESYDSEPDDVRMFKAIESMQSAMKTYSVEELSKMTENIREKNLKTYMKLDFTINLRDKLPI